uniref:chemotaxis protein CheB n=1 Tax=Bradyrhizobium sp. (strain ORS 278) TaxID=114615 RepID=UPI001FCAF8A9|nr:chemotaxis protein CheB [Bradyrhizobium sp. ORS 278]
MLGRRRQENMVRDAVGPLFRSAALQDGPRVIGIVLRRLLSDGTAGLNAMKRAAAEWRRSRHHRTCLLMRCCGLR